jgi:hypothetical protein
MRLGIPIGLVLLCTACGKGGEPELGGTFCDPKKLVLDAAWSDFGPAPLDGTETSACATLYSMSLQYRDQPEDRQVKRITDVLQSKGYHEVAPQNAAARVDVSPPVSPAGRPSSAESFVETSKARVFQTDHDQISVVVQRFPHNAGHPFLIDLGRFVTKPKQ